MSPCDRRPELGTTHVSRYIADPRLQRLDFGSDSKGQDGKPCHHLHPLIGAKVGVLRRSRRSYPNEYGPSRT